MKKVFLSLSALLLLAACAKNAEQIEAAKTKMKTDWKQSDEEVSKYEFQTSEVVDKDAYLILAKNYTDRYDKYKDTDLEIAKINIAEVEKFTDLASKSSNKTFYVVKAYSIVTGDTIHKKIFYIDDKNSVIDVENIK
jgi:hypothetical protein